MNDPLQNPASQMYTARAEAEIAANQDLYKRNPESRRFYFKGVEDVITSIRAITAERVPPHVLALILDGLHAEASGTANVAQH